MIIINQPEEGIWFKFTTRGETVELKIRPLSAEVLTKIRKKYKMTKMERDPQTRQMVKVDYFDEEAIAQELVDYLLEDFKGFASAPNVPLPVTPENKRKIFELPPAPEDTMSISDFIFEKSREIAAISEKEFEELEKN